MHQHSTISAATVSLPKVSLYLVWTLDATSQPLLKTDLRQHAMLLMRLALTNTRQTQFEAPCHRPAIDEPNAPLFPSYATGFSATGPDAAELTHFRFSCRRGTAHTATPKRHLNDTLVSRRTGSWTRSLPAHSNTGQGARLGEDRVRGRQARLHGGTPAV